MAGQGMRTSELDSSETVDHLIGNYDGNTVKTPVGSLATQLAMSGAVADVLTEATESLENVLSQVEETDVQADALELRLNDVETDISDAGARLTVAEADQAQNAADIAQLEASQTTNKIAKQLWSDLSGVSGTLAGQGATVLDGDTGTHTDPVSGTTVPNAGEYSWSTSPAGWEWIGETGLPGKVSYSDGLTVEPQADYASIVDENGVQLLGFTADGKAVVNDLEFLSKDSAFGSSDVLPFGVYDPSGHFQLLWAEDNGRISFVPSDYTMAEISKQLTSNEPDVRVAVWGDSMLPLAFITAFEAALGREIYRGSVGGLQTESIGQLQGALPCAVTVSGGQIPATETEVDLTDVGFAGREPYNNQTSALRQGVLAGVPGTLRRYGVDGAEATLDKYTFTRTTAGSVVDVDPGTQFVFDDAVNRSNWTTVIGSGRNDWSDFASDLDPVALRETLVRHREYIERMVAYLTASEKRYLILSVHTGVNQGVGTTPHTVITRFNDELHASFAPHYVDTRAYMVSDAIYDAINAGDLANDGSFPTTDDLADMANDTVPRSLIQSDGVHYEAFAFALKADFVARQLQNRGW